jgi:hypothetical protein
MNWLRKIWNSRWFNTIVCFGLAINAVYYKDNWYAAIAFVLAGMYAEQASRPKDKE